MLLSVRNLGFLIIFASAEANCDRGYYVHPTQDIIGGFPSPQGFPPQQFNGTMQMYDNTGDWRGNFMNFVGAREIKNSFSPGFGKQLAGIVPSQQVCDRSSSGNGANNRGIGESDAILNYGNSFVDGFSYNFGNNGYNGSEFPKPGKMMIMDRKHLGKNLPCVASETIIKVTTSFMEKPPTTVTPPPRIITFTKMEEPVTKTLPPLIFRVPTTVFKKLRPVTVTTTLPPQIIKQPPTIKAAKQKMVLPPSTVFVNKTSSSIIQTVNIPGPVIIVPTKLSKAYKHVAQGIPSPLVKKEHKFLTPSGAITAEGGSGHNRSFGPNRNNNLYEVRSGSGNGSGNGPFYGPNPGSKFGSESGNSGFSGIGSYDITHNGKDTLSTGGKPDTGSTQNPSFCYLNGNQGNGLFNGGFSQQSGTQFTENIFDEFCVQS